MSEGLSPVGVVLERAFDKNIPVNLLFELTYRCNLRCGHCYICDSGQNELGLAEIGDILDQLAKAGCLFLTLSGGELMMRPDWLDILQYARRRAFAVRIFTNGTLLDEEGARAIADIGVVDVGLSLYGSKPETHDAVTGVSGSYEATMRATGLLTTLGISTTARYLLMNHNFSEYQEARKIVESKGATFTFSFHIGPQVDGGKSPLDWRLNDDNLKTVLQDGFLYAGTTRVPRPETADTRKPEHAAAPMCGAGRDNCMISPYGEVKPCTMLPVVAGDLRKESFEQIWRKAPVLQDLRGISMKDVKTCRECRSVGYCGRCPGFALLEDGDIMGPSSYACHVEAVGESLSK